MTVDYIGKVLDGRYEINSLIGAGGMSNVFRAIDKKTGQVVAVKFLKPEFFDDDEIVRRFKNESKAISLLNHPNIIKVFDINIKDDEKYIVIEYINGITLREYIDREGKLTYSEISKFIKDILKAVDHAHEHGIIHRDLKPQNIMILRDGSIKIMDFGIARLATAGQKTMTNNAIGSVHYISPEQVKAQNVDGRADIYSIGIMLYEMITGKLPFDGDTAVDVAMKQITQEPQKPSEIARVPEKLEAIILKAMKKSADDRYQNANEMISDIEDFEAERNITAAQKKKKASPSLKELLPARKKVFKKAPNKPKKKFKIAPLSVMALISLTTFICSAIFIYMTLKLNDSPILTRYENVELPNFVGQGEAVTKSGEYKFKFVIEYEHSAKHTAGVIIRQAPKPPKTVKENSVIKLKVSKGALITKMPSLKNYTESDAMFMLNELESHIIIIREESEKYEMGRVIKTTPNAGELVTAGDTITIYVSKGGEADRNRVPVPNITGLSSISDATKILAKNNLTIGSVTREYNDSPKDTVARQYPVSGEMVKAGSAIDVVISDGPEPCEHCGSTEHKTDSHPPCEFCDSIEHFTEEHECENCGEKGDHITNECIKCTEHKGAHIKGECPDPCEYCQSIEHTSEEHPECEICKAKEHATVDHPTCSVCGAVDHVIHPTPTPTQTPTPTPTPTPEQTTTPTPENSGSTNIS